MNELCEEVYGRKAGLLEDLNARESLVEVCQRFRWMSVQDVDKAFKQLPNFDPAKVPTEAQDMGRPADSGRPAGDAHQPGGVQPLRIRPVSGGLGAVPTSVPPKVVIFCLDWSASMMSRDTGTALNRFDTCLSCVQVLMREQVRDCDLIGFI